MGKGAAISCLLFAIGGMPAIAEENEAVAAEDYFADDSRPVIYIEVADGQTLVFDASKNDRYILNGRPLEIRASRLVSNGAVLISSRKEKETKGVPDKPSVAAAGATAGKNSHGTGDDAGPGNTGNPAVAGFPGSSAKAVSIWAKAVQINGTLTIDTSGVKGGTGGEGGDGGLGAHGGNGSDSDGNSPGKNGGTGGPGGLPADGGEGGPGGNAGDIKYSSSFCSALATKAFIVRVDKGEGGEPGAGGVGGGPGPRGEPGGGKGSYGGGDPGRPGLDRTGVRGKQGPRGKPGKDGAKICADCPNGACLKKS